jgi:penicillin-binding protein 1A
MSRRERERRRRRGRGGPSRILFLGLGLVGTVAIIGGLTAVAWVISVADQAPSLDHRKPLQIGATSRVYAADGTRLGFIQADVLRTPIRAGKIPQSVRDATVAVEDRRFYQHKGVDFEGIVRAGVRNLESKNEVQGGSTLTMQLVRNLYTGERQRTLARKIREAKLAEELERLHPGRQGKLWILDKYLNSVPYGTVGGQTAVGIQAAARVFFDKPASKLTLRESALLAGLPQAPSQYNPFLNRAGARQRRDEVLQRMAAQGYITQARARHAMRRGLGVERSSYYTQRRQRYFFDYVKQQLIDKYGLNTVRRGGLRIYTTLDLHLQKLAKANLDGRLGAPDRSGALVTIDPRNGHILAMASSSRYDDSKFNLAAQGHRQAGSTFKVMVLMTALRKGVDPNTTTYTSKPLNFTDPRYGKIDVQTYSHSYLGRVNLVRATLASDNSVYQQLDLDLGPKAVTKTARMMGITSTLHSYPAEGLGGLEEGVSPLEMAGAYATIASGGIRRRPIAITKVVFPDGRVRHPFKTHAKRVFSDGVAYEATKILQENILRGTGFPNATAVGCPAAGKTGTTDSFTDAWFVGYTPRLATAMWLGHETNRIPMYGVAGGTIPALIWGQYMREAHGGFCGGFKAPKHPFHARPFSGRYEGGGAPTGPSYTPTTPYTPTSPTYTPTTPTYTAPTYTPPTASYTPPSTSTGTSTGGTSGGAAQQYSPNNYASPSQ